MAKGKTAEPDDAIAYESQDAIEHDAILAEIPDDCLAPSGATMAHVEGAMVQATDGADMSATFVIVTRTRQPNRNGNMLQLTANENGKGLVIDEFNRNPVVLFDHGFSFPFPLGAARDPSGKSTTRLTKQRGVSTVHFSRTLPMANDIFGLVDERILQAASIGFDPQLAMRIQKKAQRLPEGVDDWRWVGFDFVQAELWEWSIVRVGADAGALRQRIERGTVGGMKVCRQFAQVFEPIAEPVPKTGRGFGPHFEAICQSAGVTAEEAGELQTFLEQSEPESIDVDAAGRALTAIQRSLSNFDESSEPYGTCPHCSSPVVTRERRPGGNDECQKGHVYPSAATITEAASQAADTPDDGGSAVDTNAEPATNAPVVQTIDGDTLAKQIGSQLSATAGQQQHATSWVQTIADTVAAQLNEKVDEVLSGVRDDTAQLVEDFRRSTGAID